MARPIKQGLEYFRHYSKIQGKTMDTLQAEYGNDGYAFWFKLLEILAQQSNLSYDCNNAANWRYLVSNAKMSREKAEEIMDLLCDLEAVDPELWRENRVIWVQNLTDNADEVFKKRQTDTPHKPSFCDGNDSIDDVSVAVSTQSKVKESKVNKSIVKESKDTCPEPCQATDSPQVISLTLNDKSEFPIFQHQVDEWSELYPAVDVLQELRGMRGWLSTNPQKRKTKTGILRFVNAWLAREQNKGGAQVRGSPAVKSDGEALAAAMRRFGV